MSDLSDLFDKPVSITHATSVGLWLAGFALIIGDMFIPWPLAALGLFVAGAGGVLTIRGYLLHMHEREIQAFEIGRKAGALKSIRD